MEPRVKKIKTEPPPYALNDFPKDFTKKLAENIVALLACKPKPSISGNEWEQIFARTIGANWKNTNVGLRDVFTEQTCWGAKTVQGSGNIGTQASVRLISGRNNLKYSYGYTAKPHIDDANLVGKLVLGIWNQRVEDIKKDFRHTRIVVLVRNKDCDEYLVFEKELAKYNPEDYEFTWNTEDNLEGFSKSKKQHKFTWQVNGQQFTIIEDIPEARLHIKIKRPVPIPQADILKTVGFDDTWVEVV